MSWWQGKLLRYALRYGLSRTGLLNDEILDLDNLDIKIGSKNVIELRDVGLNIAHITKLTQLPPCLRLETARVLLLRITIPADFYQANIVAEVDGVDLLLRFEDEGTAPQPSHKARPQSPTNVRTPQHRKTNRRLHSNSPDDYGSPVGTEGDVHFPSTQEVARSFLRDEPLSERQELEASVAIHTQADGLEESLLSEGSDNDELGTGMAMGVPGFLVNFLQGIADRFIFDIKNVEVKVEADIGGDSQYKVPLTLQLRVGNARLDALNANQNENETAQPSRRGIKLSDISLDFLTDVSIFEEVPPVRDSSSSSDEGHQTNPALQSGSFRPSTGSSFVTRQDHSPEVDTAQSTVSLPQAVEIPEISPTGSYTRSSYTRRQIGQTKDGEFPFTELGAADGERDTDGTITGEIATGENITDANVAGESQLDIQLGDDNISWGSRRSQSNAPAEDLWSSMASEDELPNSLLIEPERAATPRAASSRGGSPSTLRARRPVSPYDRAFRSPGSWPTLEESPAQPWPRSPRSWPRLDQSQHSTYEPMAHVLETARHQHTDNKKTALEITQSVSQSLGTFSTGEGDMSQSRLFSHEEAQSMYMSAMTSGSGVEMPARWTTENDNSPSLTKPDEFPMDHSDSSQESEPEPRLRPVSEQERGSQWEQGPELELEPELETEPEPKPEPEPEPELELEPETGDLDAVLEEVPSQRSHGLGSGNVTPRAQTPIPEPVSPVAPTKPPRIAKRLLSVDILSVILPPFGQLASDDDSLASPIQDRVRGSSHYSHGMPGTFSAYSEMSSSRRGLAAMSPEERSDRVPSRESPAALGRESQLDFKIGNISVLLDEPTIRLLLKTSHKVLANIERGAVHTTSLKTKKVKEKTMEVSLSVSVDRFSLSVCSRIETGAGGSDRHGTKDTNALIGLQCQRLYYSDSGAVEVKMRAMGLSVCGTEFLSFDPAEENAIASRTLSKDDTSIAIRMSSYQATAAKRSVKEVTMETSPMRLRLDTALVEEAIEGFGGIENIIGLGSSIAPENAESSLTTGTKTSKGVRFAGESSNDSTEPEYKINARLGGIIATLYGSQCAIVLRTSTVKAVHRELGAIATVEHIFLTGPYDDKDSYDAPISVELTSLRLDYLMTPHDKDLERLLSLLTPSKDKYENDDDILIDTLLRQRRKGGLLRLSTGGLKFKLDDWACTSSLSMLSDELTKVSAVAKYLPEDERPGILALCRVKEFEAQLPINEDFGNVKISVQDFHLAHVGLPSLLAFSIGSIGARKMDDTVLLHDLLPLPGTENLPMIMARMLGDEADPIVRIKLYNICVEYGPSIVAALANMDQGVDVEEVAASLLRTVADLAVSDARPTGDADAMPQKTVNVDLLIHESAIGLSPHELNSKALFVLTDAQFATRVPPGDVITIKSDFRQASILLTDDATAQDDSDDLGPTGTWHVHFAGGRSRLLDSLSKRGFVSVISIMSAFVTVRIREENADAAKSIEVDVRNELLLVETCADSTQTLIATLSALAPPSPPSNAPRYLTEPMSIEDMMASFTGDAIEERASPPETLFDADADTGSNVGSDSPLAYSTFIEDADGLLAESELTSSLYGPISGMLEVEEDPDNTRSTTEHDGYPETAESLLEEDPFEMTISPEDMPLGDAALMRSLAKQCKPAVSDRPVDADLYEVDDLGFDALPNSHSILGDQYRFNAPHAGHRRGQMPVGDSVLPFRLKLRDVHIIWNLYDGYDWQWTRDGITEAVEQVEQKAEARRARHRQSLNDRDDDEPVIEDFLFNSIYIGVPAGADAQELRRQINRNIDDQISETESVPASAMTRPTNYSSSAPQRLRQRRRLKLGRSRSHKIAFELKGVSADVLSFPPGKGDVMSSVDLRLRDFEIFDNMPTSTWRKFLTHLDNDPAAREMSKPMFHIVINTVKTLESHSASELTLNVSVLPLRLHVDQDALDFITRFFEFKDKRTVTSNSGGEQPFLQRVEVDTVDLCLDYKPKHVDYVGLRFGRTKEFINFVTLDGANIRLKHAIVYGLRGFDTLHDTLNNVWVPDVTRNQLPTVLAGLAPVRSLVNIGSGVRDVIAIPVREYQKDGRIIRSIQKGAYQFGKTTASELARLGAKVALGTQNVLTSAEEYLSPTRAVQNRPGSARGTSSDQGWHDIASEDEETPRRAVSAYANQPLGVLSGLRSARRYLEHDLLTAKDALIAVQGEVLESRGPGAAAAAVARHAPTVILRPVIGATRAVGTTLLGVGNQIDRSNMRKVDDKYKRR